MGSNNVNMDAIQFGLLRILGDVPDVNLRRVLEELLHQLNKVKGEPAYRPAFEAALVVNHKPDPPRFVDGSMTGIPDDDRDEDDESAPAGDHSKGELVYPDEVEQILAEHDELVQAELERLGRRILASRDLIGDLPRLLLETKEFLDLGDFLDQTNGLAGLLTFPPNLSCADTLKLLADLVPADRLGPAILAFVEEVERHTGNHEDINWSIVLSRAQAASNKPL